MSTTLSLAVLATIAQLRVQGSPWAPIAEQLGYDEQKLRIMLREQGDEFQRELDIARRDLMADLFIDCVTKLRDVMNGGQHSKESTSAAKALLRVCEQHQRQAQRATTPCKSQPMPKPDAEPEREPAPMPVKQAPPMAAPIPAIDHPPTPTPVGVPVAVPNKVVAPPTAMPNQPFPPPRSGTITTKTLCKRMFAKATDKHGAT